MSDTPPTPADASARWTSPPPPDTPEGGVLALGFVVGLVYVLLLVGTSVTLSNEAGEFIAVPLILGTIGTLAAVGLLSSEMARIRMTELELARTVGVHEHVTEMPSQDSAMGIVWREYAVTATDFRRSARSHAYALGPILWGTMAALAATILWGIGSSTGTLWVIQLGLVIEIPALTLLTVGFAILGLAIGSDHAVNGYAALTPRRWRQYDERNAGIESVISSCPWLAHYCDELRNEPAKDRPTVPAPASSSVAN